VTPIAWTHPSVRRLLQDEGASDPVATIEQRARDVALEAIESGWRGPPYDPFELADVLSIGVVARQDLEDACLVSAGEETRIEFNPQRRPARIRFSVAHEIGHFLFADHADRVRFRSPADLRGDEWQLEVLCNVAAAELLMPTGAFPLAETEDLSLSHLLDLRARFAVSTEALLRRVVKLTARPVCLFAAARLAAGEGFRIDYFVPSRAWRPTIESGYLLPIDSVLSHCTAVGFSDEATERWGGEELHVQAVGVPPYPGDRFPRLVGLLEPAPDSVPPSAGLRYVRGDALQPRRDGPSIIAHVVNDRARTWGGRGFAAGLTRRFPAAKDDFERWTSGSSPRLGTVHLFEASADFWIASMVAQAGYGDTPSTRPRLRLTALRRCLEQLASMATERDAGVHMPLIGTGQGGTPWPRIRDLVLEELAGRHVRATAYVLPDAQMPEDAPAEDQLTLV
jgi:O-acetyl-ADP-ribose deacetylase (regulator of RNase III)